jgi:SecD/SecF fusion protein
MVGAMIIFGGKGLADFALILFIGVLFGTYSSTFIASALAYDWIRHRTTKQEAEKEAARKTGGRLARATK